MSLAAFAAAWILAAGHRDLLDVSADFGPDRFLFAYPVVGTVLVARRPANRIGWLLLSVGVIAAVRALAGEYALNALTGPTRPATAVWADRPGRAGSGPGRVVDQVLAPEHVGLWLSGRDGDQPR